ncbi:MAG: hypothetical protein KA714_05390 [Limnoraphis sp. WC205]|nr:hypothetical protein [Limnoraphis sp. WC205]
MGFLNPTYNITQQLCWVFSTQPTILLNNFVGFSQPNLQYYSTTLLGFVPQPNLQYYSTTLLGFVPQPNLQYYYTPQKPIHSPLLAGEGLGQRFLTPNFQAQ